MRRDEDGPGGEHRALRRHRIPHPCVHALRRRTGPRARRRSRGHRCDRRALTSPGRREGHLRYGGRADGARKRALCGSHRRARCRRRPESACGGCGDRRQDRHRGARLLPPRPDAQPMGPLPHTGRIVDGLGGRRRPRGPAPGRGGAQPHGPPPRTPGGSSMGWAAAAAGGVVPLGGGSQTNGSVIRPAAFCGVVGFKPTAGRLSREGVFEFSRTLDQVGGFAGSVREAAAFTAAMAGEPIERWGSGDATPPKLPPDRTGGGGGAEDAARARFQADVDRLAAGGGPVEGPSPPLGLDDAPAILRTIMLFEAARALASDTRGREDLISEIARRALAEGAATPGEDYRAALRDRDRLIDAFVALASRYDAILTPPAVGEAPTPETTGDPRFCSRWSLVGAPAIVIPSGLGPHRLPLGLQLVAAPGDDRRLLAAAAWCEAHLPSIGRPPL